MTREPGARVELRIERLAAGGDGVARLEGSAVFVRATAPGDRVLAELVEVHARFAHARLLEVLEPGPARRPSPCVYFPACGGCSWLHLSEAAQSQARIQIVQDALQRIGGFDALPPIEELPSPAALGYRSRARVAYESGRIGFRAPRSHEVVDVERCAVLDVETQALLSELRAHPPRGGGELELRGYGERARVADEEYRVGPRSFFQPNRALWKAWRDAVAEACGRGKLAVELYAGVGFYTRALEARFERVVAVERGAAAHDARQNSRASVIDAAAESWAPAQLPDLSPDLVLLNPPRTGCHRSVSEAIGRCAPRRLVYVSCDPATLARDLRRMGPELHIERVCVIDALPQTHHVEIICTSSLTREVRGN